MSRLWALLYLAAGCRLNFDDVSASGDRNQLDEIALLAGATTADVRVCSERAGVIDWVLTSAAIAPGASSVDPLLAGAEASDVGVAVTAHGCITTTVRVAATGAVNLLGVITTTDGAVTPLIATATMHPVFESYSFTNDDNRNESYVIHYPESYYRDPAAPMPTIVFLHGWGEKVTDTAFANFPRTHFLRYFGDRRPEVRDLPFAVIAPQCDDNFYSCWGWIGAVGVVEYALDHAESRGVPIDPSRLYATGLSTGGEGAWRLAMDLPNVTDHQDHHRIAAAVPTLSTLTPDSPSANYVPSNICRVASVPVWAFHCEEDSSQPVTNDQTYVDLANACPGGGNASLSVGHWMFQGSSHAGFVEVYTDTHGFTRDGHSSIYTWLLTHTR